MRMRMTIESWAVGGLLALAVAFPGCKAPEACIPAGDIDRLAMTATLDVEIAGIGRDEIVLRGDVGVHRTGPVGEDGKTMRGELISATMRGKSEVFGDVIALESPLRHSTCEYVCNGPGDYEGRFEIYGWFWMPEHGIAVFSDDAVVVAGAATAIPPLGSTAVMPAGEIALRAFDRPTGNPIGTLYAAKGEVGELVEVDDGLARPQTTVPALLGE